MFRMFISVLMAALLALAALTSGANVDGDAVEQTAQTAAQTAAVSAAPTPAPQQKQNPPEDSGRADPDEGEAFRVF